MRPVRREGGEGREGEGGEDGTDGREREFVCSCTRINGYLCVGRSRYKCKGAGAWGRGWVGEGFRERCVGFAGFLPDTDTTAHLPFPFLPSPSPTPFSLSQPLQTPALSCLCVHVLTHARTHTLPRHTRTVDGRRPARALITNSMKRILSMRDDPVRDYVFTSKTITQASSGERV